MTGFTGVCIYYNQDLSSEIDKINTIINRANKISREFQLKKFQLMFSSSDRFTRDRSLNKENIIRLSQELPTRIYDSISFFDRGKDRDDFNFHLALDLFVSDDKKSKETDKYPQNLILLIENRALEDNQASINELVEFGEMIWLTLKCGYGFIYSAADYNDVHSELTAIPIRTFDGELTIKDLEGEDELDFYQKNREKLGKYIRKAYWGNFINKDHVRKLGGYNLIQTSSYFQYIKELSIGGAYLQLTGYPLDFIKSDFKAKLQKADEFLKPIKLPNTNKD